MKILIATDAWTPQINGVVRTLEETMIELKKFGHDVFVISHQHFKTFSLPTYKEIKLSWNLWKVGNLIRNYNPEAVHIATEGPIGLATRLYCQWNKIPFTTSYHTKFPEYVNLRAPWISIKFMYAIMRWFHKPSKRVLVTTPSMKTELEQHEFKNEIVVWSRGVDFNIFNIDDKFCAEVLSRRVLLYVGRVSPEKNIEAFLQLNIPGAIKWIVGDGPSRVALQAKYTDAYFLGYKQGDELASCYKGADVFVFPSKSDTFGIVMIEANACGLPVAAYPVTGPIDFIINGSNGYLDDDLEQAVLKALTLRPVDVHKYVRANYSWESCTKTFEQTLVKYETFKE